MNEDKREIKDLYRSISKDKQDLIDNCNDLLEKGYELLSYTKERDKNGDMIWHIATLILYETNI
jgi:predicted nucleic acid-binding Zn ribbon protein